MHKYFVAYVVKCKITRRGLLASETTSHESDQEEAVVTIDAPVTTEADLDKLRTAIEAVEAAGAQGYFPNLPRQLEKFYSMVGAQLDESRGTRSDPSDVRQTLDRGLSVQDMPAPRLRIFATIQTNVKENTMHFLNAKDVEACFQNCYETGNSTNFVKPATDLRKAYDKACRQADLAVSIAIQQPVGSSSLPTGLEMEDSLLAQERSRLEGLYKSDLAEIQEIWTAVAHARCM